MSHLHRLIRSNDLDGVRRALSDSSDARALANEADAEGHSPLFEAVSGSETGQEIVVALLDAGANVDFVHVRVVPGIEDLTDIPFAEMGIEIPEGIDLSKPKEFRESLIQKAIRRGDVGIVELLRSRGADLAYRDPHDQTALIDAVHGPGDRSSIVRYLVGLGLDPNVVTSHGETAIGSAYRGDNFEVVKMLIEAGADPKGLRWTPLLRAIAIGTDEEVEAALASDSNRDAEDVLNRSALALAVAKGNTALARRLKASGKKIKDGSLLSQAVESGCLETLRWLIEEGVDPNSRDDQGDTPLAIAVGRDDLEMVKILLSEGADPNLKGVYSSALDGARSSEAIRLLLTHGANPAEVDHETLRVFLDLGERNDDLLSPVSQAEFHAGRIPAETRANPEETTGPFRVAMIRSGSTAYGAEQHFGYSTPYSCSVKGDRPTPLWCAVRFGQTFTVLPDGRTILIGGEHEDYYDSNFCIYNDVFVFEPDGRIRTFGYPYAIFPPTDFHTATLVGEWIYILGSLGYVGQRGAKLPAWRLNTRDYRIEPLSTSGKVPDRIYDHQASLIGDGKIQIEGGKRIRTGFLKKEVHEANEDRFQLDLRTLVWSKQ